MTHDVLNESALKTWVVVCLLVLFVVAKAFYAFFVIGDRGQPTWDYRATYTGRQRGIDEEPGLIDSGTDSRLVGRLCRLDLL